MQHHEVNDLGGYKSGTNTDSLSTQQNHFWEANTFSASQKIPRILWNPKVYYGTHNSPPPAPVLCQINPVHVAQFHFIKIHFNIILPPKRTHSNTEIRQIHFESQQPHNYENRSGCVTSGFRRGVHEIFVLLRC